MELSDIENLGIILTGGTGAEKVRYKVTGDYYVFKTNRGNIQQVINEYIALQLYQLIGVRVPKSQLVYDNGKIVGLAIEFIKGKGPGELYDADPERFKRELGLKIKEAVRNDYIIHILLTNWDVNIGANYLVPVNEEGEPMYDKTLVIDTGGALFFRALGQRKTDFTRNIANIRSINTFSKKSTLKLYENMSKDEICSRWQQVDQTAIKEYIQQPSTMELLQQIRGGTDLPAILEGRMKSIDAFCSSNGGKRKTHRRKYRKRSTRRYR
jgi:hypothetical protein